jgi:cold shock CspA family protein
VTDEPWHLDRRVPVALILTIAVQTAAAIWWAASVSATLSDQARTNDRQDILIDRQSVQIEGIRAIVSGQAVQLGRIEEGLSGLRADMGRLISTLERRAP